jgi:hypothetical protein
VSEADYSDGQDCGNYTKRDPSAFAATTATVFIAVVWRHPRARRRLEKVASRCL